MGGQPADLVKLGVGVVVTAGALRYLWKYLSADSVEKKPSCTFSSPKGSPSKASDTSASEGIWIYYGSQSGTAEGFSNELEQECQQHGLQATVVDMEEFDPEEFKQHRAVVIMVATYGEGDPTDNATEFFKYISDDSLSSDTFAGMKFTVMGLGNRQYVHFNACAKTADKHIERLGATRIYDRGEGDDDQNIEEDFEQWKENGLWPALQAAVGAAVQPADGGAEAAAGLEAAEDVKSKLPLKAVVGEDKSAPPIDPLVQNGGADVLGKWYFTAAAAPIVVNDELRQVRDEEVGKTTRHIEFDIKNLPSLEWKTADNLEVLPRNTEDTVMWFARRLGVEEQLDCSMAFVRAPGVEKAVRKPFPAPCSVRNALTLYCDLNAAPAKGVAKKFAALASDPEDRALLEGLLHDRETYHWLTSDGVHLSFREFFELFLTSADIDFGTFVQLCPRQKSRPYTISSSSKENPRRIGICVSMVQEDSMPSLAKIVEDLAARGHPLPNATSRSLSQEPRRFRGSCSTMLCTQSVRGDKLMITARPSSFRLPRRATTPIIMLGAGTGLAPFRAFVREFRAEGGKRPNTILFFGCQKQNEDFIYREELQEALKSEPPALKELITAFSREQDHKVYVQHRFRERAEEVASLLAQGAYVYVCGATSMGKCVREELIAILKSSEQLDRLQRDGRFVEELW